MNPLPDILERAARAEVPYASIVELTRRCNLACRHCYAAPERGRPELTAAQLGSVVEELHALGSLFITFSGGDPTVSRGFLEVLRRASDLRMAVQFFSNGLLIGEEAADELASMRLFHAGLSLYGARAETHDRVTRRAGSHAGTLAAARRLRDRGVHVVLKFIAMRPNVAEYDEMKALAAREGVVLKVDTVISPRDDLNRDTTALSAEAADVRRILEEQEPVLRVPPDPDGRDLGCVMGRTLVCVNAYGDVFPCVTLPIPAGNVRYTPLREIWEEAPFLRAMRRYPDRDRMHGCPGCGYRAYCRRCPGNTFTETGDLYGPSPSACREATLRSDIDRARGGPGADTDDPPPGLEGHLPGWTPAELVAASGGGCTSHGAAPVRFGRTDF